MMKKVIRRLMIGRPEKVAGMPWQLQQMGCASAHSFIRSERDYICTRCGVRVYQSTGLYTALERYLSAKGGGCDA